MKLKNSKPVGIAAGVFLILVGIFTILRPAHNFLLALACVVAGIGMIVAYLNMPQDQQKK
ncbi:hypothetical protein [Lacticaseibacillus jixiensis]|uniref:hypothetical protein n=1 Tax=Lacticaseibacillus jixiensis TaxID=3231926 RepID=UPI0036F1AC43